MDYERHTNTNKTPELSSIGCFMIEKFFFWIKSQIRFHTYYIKSVAVFLFLCALHAHFHIIQHWWSLQIAQSIYIEGWVTRRIGQTSCEGYVAFAVSVNVLILAGLPSITTITLFFLIISWKHRLPHKTNQTTKFGDSNETAIYCFEFMWLFIQKNMTLEMHSVHDVLYLLVKKNLKGKRYSFQQISTAVDWKYLAKMYRL